MAVYILNRSKLASLAAQIRVAERQVLCRRRSVDARAASLIRKICQQMTAPASMLLAGGIGFIIGELTKCPVNSREIADKSRVAGASPLISVLNFITSARTLYAALPLAWLTKSFHQWELRREKRPNANSTARHRRPGH